VIVIQTGGVAVAAVVIVAIVLVRARIPVQHRIQGRRRRIVGEGETIDHQGATRGIDDPGDLIVMVAVTIVLLQDATAMQRGTSAQTRGHLIDGLY